MAGQWRLPNVRELESLVHLGVFDPALPNTAGTGKWAHGDPFIGVLALYYWSSTTSSFSTAHASNVGFLHGIVGIDFKTVGYHVWPVRGPE